MCRYYPSDVFGANCFCAAAGEVALPGGKRDEGDTDDAATALREAHEEIGLPPAAVEVVTVIEPFLSKVEQFFGKRTVAQHLLLVTPVVGLLADGHEFLPAPNPSEVAAVFSAPLHMFLEAERHRHDDLEWLGMPYRVHFFEHVVEVPPTLADPAAMAAAGTPADMGSSAALATMADAGDSGTEVAVTIWGLTAAILIRTAAVVFKQPPAFSERHPAAPDYSAAVADLVLRGIASR
eukprot:SM000361S13808  [mRNA]  locus=s361:1328:2458:- [translate_table: standard]